MGKTGTAEVCMEVVKEARVLAFAFEEGGRGGNICYSEAIDMDPSLDGIGKMGVKVPSCAGRWWSSS